MSVSLSRRSLATAAMAVAALACGEVPTLADGIAYIGPVALPALSVALGDTLRDSLGRVAPIRVVAFDKADVLIPGVAGTFVVVSAPAGVKVSATGVVVAGDSTGSLRLVARIGDRLQTTEATLFVVPQPNALARSSTTRDSVTAPGISPPLLVTVTGTRNATRVPVQGVVVRYEIVSLFPAGAVDSVRFRLLDDANNTVRSDPRVAVDTTDSSGQASRRLTVVTAPGTDSVRVSVTARSLRGAPLGGTPLTISVPVVR